MGNDRAKARPLHQDQSFRTQTDIERSTRRRLYDSHAYILRSLDTRLVGTLYGKASQSVLLQSSRADSAHPHSGTGTRLGLDTQGVGYVGHISSRNCDLIFFSGASYGRVFLRFSSARFSYSISILPSLCTTYTFSQEPTNSPQKERTEPASSNQRWDLHWRTHILLSRTWLRVLRLPKHLYRSNMRRLTSRLRRSFDKHELE